MSEEIFEFPCRFPIKVMGRDVPEFQAHVLETITMHTSETPVDIRATPSAKGNFVSVTVTFTAESREQLDKIYRSLVASDHVLVVL